IVVISFFFSSRRRHTRFKCDWSSDVCSSDLPEVLAKVLTEYRVYAKKVPLKDGDYTMDHTALVYLMDRNGRFVAPFNLKRTPEEIGRASCRERVEIWGVVVCRQKIWQQQGL